MAVISRFHCTNLFALLIEMQSFMDKSCDPKLTVKKIQVSLLRVTRLLSIPRFLVYSDYNSVFGRAVIMNTEKDRYIP